MKLFAIFYLWTIFYASLAPAQEDVEVVCPLKKVKIDTYLDKEKTSRTFNNGGVNLYKINHADSDIMQMYKVGNHPHDVSGRFPIHQCCTMVFEDKVIIRAPDRIITVTADENTFDFYQRIYHLDELTETFPVIRIYHARNVYENMFIKAKSVDFDAWIFVAMDGDGTPRLLFPTDPIKVPKKIETAKEVIVILKTVPETVITIEFDGFAKANTFHEYVREIIKNNPLTMC